MSAEPTLSGKKRADGAGLVSGSRLGRYEIVKRIAAGGMAELFLARTAGMQSIQQVVVIKRILPQLATQAQFVEMFLDEARIAATLQHPNVVQMHDVGEENGNYYIAMEYLHGEDARSMVVAALRQQRRVPLPVVLHLVTGVAAGLHYAHDKVDFDGRPLRIVHRDVTPQNIVVTFDGNVKLVDFGIAKASNRLNETRFGTLKGKVAYMSPEQCTGQPLDRRSDIFSLGIVLFELSLCRRLFRGKSDFEILKSIVEEPIPRPTAIDRDYPPELERIVLRALARDPSERYQSAKEMQVELEHLATELQLPVNASTTSAFISEMFGRKLELWREASTKGKSLVQILEEQPEFKLDDEDENPELSPEDLSAVRRAHAGRAALLEEIERKKLVHRGDEDDPYDSTLPVDKVRLRKLGWVVMGALCAALFTLGAFVWRRLLEQRATSTPIVNAAEPVVVAPVPVPSTPPPPVAVDKPVADEPLEEEPAPPAPVANPKAERLPGRRGGKSRFERPRPALAKVTTTTATAGNGKVMLASQPWVNVTIDGKSYGQTPLGIELPAGKHLLLVTNPEFQIKRSMTITIKAGELLRKKLEF